MHPQYRTAHRATCSLLHIIFQRLPFLLWKCFFGEEEPLGPHLRYDVLRIWVEKELEELGEGRILR